MTELRTDSCLPIPDYPLNNAVSVETIYQVSKIFTKGSYDKTQRIVARLFTVTFPEYSFEFLPNDYHTFKYIRLSWQVGDNQPCFLTYEFTGEENEDLSQKAYDLVIEKARELDGVYPLVRRRRRRRTLDDE